eukprot:ctg_1175.g376
MGSGLVLVSQRRLRTLPTGVSDAAPRCSVALRVRCHAATSSVPRAPTPHAASATAVDGDRIRFHGPIRRIDCRRRQGGHRNALGGHRPAVVDAAPATTRRVPHAPSAARTRLLDALSPHRLAAGDAPHPHRLTADLLLRADHVGVSVSVGGAAGQPPAALALGAGWAGQRGSAVGQVDHAGGAWPVRTGVGGGFGVSGAPAGVEQLLPGGRGGCDAVRSAVVRALPGAHLQRRGRRVHERRVSAHPHRQREPRRQRHQTQLFQTGLAAERGDVSRQQGHPGRARMAEQVDHLAVHRPRPAVLEPLAGGQHRRGRQGARAGHRHADLPHWQPAVVLDDPGGGAAHHCRAAVRVALAGPRAPPPGGPQPHPAAPARRRVPVAGVRAGPAAVRAHRPQHLHLPLLAAAAVRRAAVRAHGGGRSVGAGGDQTGTAGHIDHRCVLVLLVLPRLGVRPHLAERRRPRAHALAQDQERHRRQQGMVLRVSE